MRADGHAGDHAEQFGRTLRTRKLFLTPSKSMGYVFRNI